MTTLLSRSEFLDLILRVKSRALAGGASFQPMSNFIFKYLKYPCWMQGTNDVYETQFEDIHVRIFAKMFMDQALPFRLTIEFLKFRDGHATGEDHRRYPPQRLKFATAKEWEDAWVTWLSRFPEALVTTVL